jgi:DNA-binding transcriptional regulator YhcF (GntR family)
MSSKYWIKLYHEVLDDPKMGMLPDTAWRRCIELFLMAGEMDAGGQLPATDKIAWRLRLSPLMLEDDLKHLEAAGIIERTDDGWLVVKFADRQRALTSTERSTLKRERDKKQEPAHSYGVKTPQNNHRPEQCNVTATEDATLRCTDKDKIRIDKDKDKDAARKFKAFTANFNDIITLNGGGHISQTINNEIADYTNDPKVKIDWIPEAFKIAGG